MTRIRDAAARMDASSGIVATGDELRRVGILTPDLRSRYLLTVDGSPTPIEGSDVRWRG